MHVTLYAITPPRHACRRRYATLTMLPRYAAFYYAALIRCCHDGVAMLRAARYDAACSDARMPVLLRWRETQIIGYIEHARDAASAARAPTLRLLFDNADVSALFTMPLRRADI